MRHTVHLMLGSGSGRLLCGIRKYVVKYGDHSANHYFKAMLYDGNDDGSSTFYRAEIVAPDDNVFVSDIDATCPVELVRCADIPSENRDEYLDNFFAELYNAQVTINDPGDTDAMSMCIYLPVYDPACWQVAESFLRSMARVPQKYEVDLFLLPYDLAFLFDDDPQTRPLRMAQYRAHTKEVTDSILAMKRETGMISHLVMIQNCNSRGVSLDLDEESFVRIVGEYALLAVDRYVEMFNPSAEDRERPIHALGLSVLSLDKYYFVQYLLHKAYIHILDREKITQEEVDINMVSRIVQEMLSKNVLIFSNFYEREVTPELGRGISQQELIARIRPRLDREIERLTAEFQSYIDRDDLSLPEKKATLAQLLGNDDELLAGYMFNKKQLVIDDCSREVLELFVSANNDLLSQNCPEVETAQTDETLAEYAALSGEDREPVHISLDEMKALRVSVRESSNYIRQKSRELEDLNSQLTGLEESQKRLTAEGFVYDGRVYRLQPDIEEVRLAEDYTPLASNTIRNIDLRRQFTPVKDQGSIGACTAFALVSIYEYILKKNKQQEVDLSEFFVYYNVRKKAGMQTQDTGSSYYDALLSMGSEGVCLEKYFPSGSHAITTEPPQPAYDDARTRKVTKALNVKVALEDLKSAIAEGYPVGISLKIYDSFHASSGFIQRPSDEEIAAGSYGNHAMVACGYSDEERVFIVRNSWGTLFGDGGYCYIPYSYMTDARLLNMACIITEINSDLQVRGSDTKTAVSFDRNDIHIKSAILRNLIEEEKVKLSIGHMLFSEKSREYNALMQKLGNNTVRETLREGTQLRLEWERRRLVEQKGTLEVQRVDALNDYDRQARRIVWMFWGSIAFWIVLYGVLCYFLPIEQVLLHDLSYVAYGLIAVESIVFTLWKMLRRRNRADLDSDYKDRIQTTARHIAERDARIEINHLKMHIAGMIVDSLAKLYHNLHSKYSGMNSFVGNLLTWHEEEMQELGHMSPLTRDPFLSLLSNECLDRYFEERKDAITHDLKLYVLFRENYRINEEDIVRFKNDLKGRLIDLLFKALDGFSVFKHIVGDETYPFLDRTYTDVDKLLCLLDTKSEIFLRTRPVAESAAEFNTFSKLLFIATDLDRERHRWKEICNKNFQRTPNLEEIASPFKLTLLQLKGLPAEDIDILK